MRRAGSARSSRPARSSRSPGKGGSTPASPTSCRSSEGAAYFALRSGVPLVPIAINGTSWLRFGGRVRVRVGEPIAVDRPADPRGRRRRDGRALGRRSTALVADAPDVPPPGRVRPLADRAVQRLARGVARGGQRGLASARSGILRPVRAWTRGRRTVAATGLSADPKEYRARLARPERRPDRRLGRGADARRRHPARDRQGRR